MRGKNTATHDDPHHPAQTPRPHDAKDHSPPKLPTTRVPPPPAHEAMTEQCNPSGASPRPPQADPPTTSMSCSLADPTTQTKEQSPTRAEPPRGTTRPPAALPDPPKRTPRPQKNSAHPQDATPAHIAPTPQTPPSPPDRGRPPRDLPPQQDRDGRSRQATQQTHEHPREHQQPPAAEEHPQKLHDPPTDPTLLPPERDARARRSPQT